MINKDIISPNNNYFPPKMTIKVLRPVKPLMTSDYGDDGAAGANGQLTTSSSVW